MKNIIIETFAAILFAFIVLGAFSSCESVPQTGTQNTQQEGTDAVLPSESELESDTQDVQQNEVTEKLPEESSTVAETTQMEIQETTPPEEDKTEIVVDIPSLIFESICSYMKNYPKLKTLKTENIVLSADEYITVCEINPDIDVIAKVEFEDTVFDLSLDEIDISKKKISDKAAFDSLLAHFPTGIKLVMCDCGYTNEEMADLRGKYSHLEFAWRIYMGKWNLRTDDEAFSVMIYDYTHTRMKSKDIEVLKYCTNMKALDLGHQAITDITVIGQMTDLRVLILADNWISDITPLSNLKNLEYLELFVNRITDLSPLAECTQLVDLNFGWNSVRDLSCIYSLENIERLWLPTTPVPYAKRAEITENFPDAKIVFADPNSISSGWRTHKRYYSMRGMFTNNKYDPDFLT